MILSLFIYSVQNRLKLILQIIQFLIYFTVYPTLLECEFLHSCPRIREWQCNGFEQYSRVLTVNCLAWTKKTHFDLPIFCGWTTFVRWLDFGPYGRDWSIVIVLDCLVPVSLLCIVLCWPFVWQDQERKGTREYRSRKEGWREWKWLMFDWLVDLIDLNLLYQQNEHTKKKIFKKDNKLQNLAPFFTVVWPRIRDEIFYFKIKIHKVSLIFKNNKIYIVSIGINCFEILSWYPVQP